MSERKMAGGSKSRSTEKSQAEPNGLESEPKAGQVFARADGSWLCKACGAENAPGRTICGGCSYAPYELVMPGGALVRLAAPFVEPSDVSERKRSEPTLPKPRKARGRKSSTDPSKAFGAEIAWLADGMSRGYIGKEMYEAGKRNAARKFLAAMGVNPNA